MDKICIECKKSLPIESFYKNKSMNDGYVNKCKECTKKGVRANYSKNRDHYVKYEQERSQRPGRKKKATEYQRKRRANNPKKYKAQNKINNSLRDGKLKREPCLMCGDVKSQAHHIDYDGEGLNIIWLCWKHHMQIHGKVAE